MKNIYLDMDGVLADFFGEFEKLIGESYKNVSSAEAFLNVAQKYINQTDFFLNLPVFDNSLSLINTITDIFNKKPIILSSPIIGDEDHTKKMKIKWLENNFGLDKFEDIIISSEKHKYASGNILIDDYLKNVVRWGKTGGIAIKYKANSLKYNFEDVIQTLEYSKKLLDNNVSLGQVLFIR